MIDILPLGSSSAGNAYRVTDGHTSLLLEAGIRFKDIQQALEFRLSDIAGCLITHDHGDHCKATKDVMKAGINVYTGQGTADILGISGHRLRTVVARQQFTIGTWTILPFEVEHDAAEPLGFILANRSGDKLLFATDTYYIRYRFTGLTHIMIECNYSIKILRENIAAGRVPAVMKNRLLRSHFSLENVKEFIRANDMRRVQEIWLLHLSDNNSDEELFKREIQALTGKQVMIARR
ncbi:MBL fold metallo-hydrolase [Paenibacillus alvei]|uniref:MBL fold metallo-hydrolase n=1 Tax=Paenibacillus alvei TaxID=44250 RepID=UPI0022806C68|nr:MBL fold metallo-hydrolase [Paenibacillus alvei]MCY9541823.1 MBL fold metallo-hydrolase [Paenibacillus alvei]MCY9704988.1 MBL fold metallo-hydrolase [Paenibacillus alvei]MCY9755315.1 MBL fold metallo-hydrolase [Paenibacillus alvei]MEC0082480.1 MBL fold metallo-hydrolase [Paenibacillus alvei]